MRCLPCQVRATIRTRRSSGLSTPVDQTLGDKAIDSDTDGARGQIDDRAYRIDCKGPLRRRSSSTPKSERPKLVSSIPAAAYLVRARASPSSLPARRGPFLECLGL
jgi:hypothetical protein